MKYVFFSFYQALRSGCTVPFSVGLTWKVTNVVLTGVSLSTRPMDTIKLSNCKLDIKQHCTNSRKKKNTQHTNIMNETELHICV